MTRSAPASDIFPMLPGFRGEGAAKPGQHRRRSALAPDPMTPAVLLRR
ncbi:hypothetical protein HMPREF0321_2817 [Dermacoccus sp. Ellin185]|nr:hypothetical protein HMPREF0321_2817 [Dermacoccus sp. Ellin185]